jgi:hypothetical protein
MFAHPESGEFDLFHGTFIRVGKDAFAPDLKFAGGEGDHLEVDGVAESLIVGFEVLSMHRCGCDQKKYIGE